MSSVTNITIYQLINRDSTLSTISVSRFEVAPLPNSSIFYSCSEVRPVSESSLRAFPCLIFLTGRWARCKTAYLVEQRLMKRWNPFYVLTDAPVVLNLMTITAGLESLLLHQVQSGAWNKKIKNMHCFKVICKTVTLTLHHLSQFITRSGKALNFGGSLRKYHVFQIYLMA